MSSTITKEMTEGWNFEGFSKSESISKSYTEGLTTATTKTLVQSSAKTIHIECDGVENPYITGLYAWVADSHDGKITTVTDLKICRYNELA
jgi:hypothetical protein